MNLEGKKVAIVHDWLVGGGAELVVLELHRMFPEAPIYTSYATREWREKLDGKVVTGYLQHLGALRKFLPLLRIWWFTHLDLRSYDIVISSSGAEAKGIKTTDNTLHVNYCHAPTHYYWSRYDEYLKNPGFGVFNPLARISLKLLVLPLRKWDYKAAQRPKVMIANSTHTSREIKKYYGRDSVVIHPPVDVDEFKTTPATTRSGFVTAGRQTPYKRIDLAVNACTRLGLPLTVIGDGPEYNKLLKMAGPTVKLVGNMPRQELVKYFGAAEAFIFPSLDDFGIVAVEAMAAGTPVIAYKAGGALDYVEPGKTGEFFDDQTVESLANVLQTFNASKFDTNVIQAKAAEFAPEVFRQKITKLISNN